MFERTKINKNKEKDILTYSIISDEYLNQNNQVLKENINLLNHKEKTIMKWVLDYYEEFKNAPKKNIEDIYQDRIIDLRTEEDADAIRKILYHISDRYDTLQNEKLNLEYETKKTESFFRLKKLEKLKRDLEETIRSEKIIEGENLIASYTRVETNRIKGIDVIRDFKEIIKLFQVEQDNVLFYLPGALRNFIGPFERGELYALMAPPKRGKTWWMIEIALRALYEHNKVLFISLEMKERSLLKRIWCNILGVPWTTPDKNYRVPFFNEDNEIEFKEDKREGLDLSDFSDFRKILERRFYGTFKIMAFPSHSANITQIEMEIQNLEYFDNFKPDVIIVDYADIIAPSGKGDYRHELNNIWIKLKAFAQKKDVALITATQGSKASISQEIKQEHIAEDMRKLAHLTRLIGLNQSFNDKKNGIMKLRILADRHREFDADKDVLCVGCYNISRPYLDSKLIKDVKNYDQKEKKIKST